MYEFQVMVIILAAILLLWAITDLRRNSSYFISWEKIIWIFIILVLPVYGPLFYLLLVKWYKNLP